MGDHMNDTHSEKIPFYVHNLFKHIVQNVNKIHLNMLMMDAHKEFEAEFGQYGYQKLKPSFFVEETINYSKLCQIFDNKLQQIVIFKISLAVGIEKSIHLNFPFWKRLYLEYVQLIRM